MSWLDVIAALAGITGLIEGWFGIAFRASSAFGFLRFLAMAAAIYLLFRFWSVWRSDLLWSLRNRLIVAYLFIAAVPILSLVTLVLLSGSILYSQLGAHLLYEDIHQRIEMVEDISEHIAIAHQTLPSGVTEAESERILSAQSHAVHDRELPGLRIGFSNDQTLPNKIIPAGKRSFAGLLQEGDALSIVSLQVIPDRKGQRVVTLRVPVTPEFLSTVAPDLGSVQMNLMERYTGVSQQGFKYNSGDAQYVAASRIVARNRTLQNAMFWFDSSVDVVSRLDAVYVGRDGVMEPLRPVFASSNARPSRLNARIFTSLGELRDSYLISFILVGIVFLLVEAAALATGIVLTRRITRAVADLYRGTQYVRAMDFSHRVRVERRDQLGMLGESFNSMTGSISGLIEEQKQLQRLENEVSIAREVQNQLFPQKLPVVPGVEIEAICKAARAVSGDYYDFIELSPTQVAIAVADISGKGISAALLMASLQAALRSLLLAPGSGQLSTAEIVARLNNHLVRNTGDDRFATFFICVYDSVTRLLRYTNAGHLPSFCIAEGRSVHLDVGGMVLGIMEDYPFQEGSLVVPSNALLVGYSDGLIEPENVYGEEFGIPRLEEVATRVQTGSPRSVAEALMIAAEEWAGTPDQADDMTVIVARLK
ncbi:MAG: hypothetical protein PVS2B2_18060 [Candidatus Acidiferrum sp.]